VKLDELRGDDGLLVKFCIWKLIVTCKTNKGHGHGQDAEEKGIGLPSDLNARRRLSCFGLFGYFVPKIVLASIAKGLSDDVPCFL
jgi:hypothetical protein